MREGQISYNKFYKENIIILESEIIEMLKEFHSYEINPNDYINLAIDKFYNEGKYNLKERYEFLERFRHALSIEIITYKVSVVVDGVKDTLVKDLTKEKLEASVKIIIDSIKKMNLFDEIDKKGFNVCKKISLVSYTLIKLCLGRDIDVTELFNELMKNEELLNCLNSLVCKDVDLLSKSNIEPGDLCTLRYIVFNVRTLFKGVCYYANLEIIKEIVNISKKESVRVSLVKSLLIKSMNLDIYNISLEDLLLQAKNKYYSLASNERAQIEAKKKYKKDLQDRHAVLISELQNLRESIKNHYVDNNILLNEIQELLYLFKSLEFASLSSEEKSSVDLVQKRVMRNNELVNSAKRI